MNSSEFTHFELEVLKINQIFILINNKSIKMHFMLTLPVVLGREGLLNCHCIANEPMYVSDCESSSPDRMTAELCMSDEKCHCVPDEICTGQAESASSSSILVGSGARAPSDLADLVPLDRRL